MITPISWDELPKHSAWPARLLGAQPFNPRQRTRDEILREYDREKWGPVLEWLRLQTNFTADDLLRQQGLVPEQTIAFMRGTELFTASEREVLDAYDQILLDALRPHHPETLVELGCGLGNRLLKVALQLKPARIYGGEFTAAGVECGQLLAARWGIAAEFRHFDYNDPHTLAEIPQEAVVFTSHSIEQIPNLRASFIEGLIQRSPRSVIHLEPCYEDQDETTMIGLMRRRYAELNDYSRNLLSRLRSFESQGRLRILEHRPNIFSDTPFNPTTLLVWQPV
jgi:hypothetical protein